MTDGNKPEQEIIPPGQPLPSETLYSAHERVFRFYGAGRGGAAAPLVDKLMRSMGVAAGLFVIAFIVYSVAQLYAGFLGIQFHLGTFWAFLAVVLCLMARMTLPITIGAFFGAMDVWGWNWFGALVFAAPGFVIFVLLAAQALFNRTKRPI